MSATTRDTSQDATSGRGRAVTVARTAALCCGFGWVGKTLLIAANGGENTNSGLVAVGWAVGMVGLLVTGAALGYLAGRRFGLVPAVIGAVIGVPSAFAAQSLVDGFVKSVHGGDGWFRDEIGLLLIGGACLLVGLLVLRPRRSE